MSYLGLDQAARKIGYAMGRYGMDAPVAGVHRLPRVDLSDGGVDYGLLMTEVSDWLGDTIAAHHITEVCYEAPYFGRDTDPTVIRKMLCVADMIEYVCRKARVGCREIEAHKWRARFIGMSQAPRSIKGAQARRKFLKQRAMDACAHRNWKVANDDEAEAAGILDYLIACDYPDHGTDALPLFREGATA